MFTRTESFQTFRRFYPIITFIIALHVLIWLYITLPLPGSILFLEQTVGVNFWVAEGQYWRLLSPIFLHIDFGHMLFNSISLILFGPALEKMLGKSKFLVAYLGAGLVANIATFLLHPLEFSHVGASGAIFGLFGIYVYLVTFRKDLVDAANAQVIITILVIGLVMTFINPNINIVAHLFGLIGGAILAPFLISGKSQGFILPSNIYVKRRSLYKGKIKGKHLLWGVIVLLVIIGLIGSV